jgi:hypothetical protein
LADVRYWALSRHYVHHPEYPLLGVKRTSVPWRDLAEEFEDLARVEHLQLFHKVTDGTPADAQLATYLLEADVVVSADKNFLRITDAVRPYAQFSIAKTKLVAGGESGATETLGFLQAGCGS